METSARGDWGSRDELPIPLHFPQAPISPISPPKAPKRAGNLAWHSSAIPQHPDKCSGNKGEMEPKLDA